MKFLVAYERATGQTRMTALIQDDATLNKTRLGMELELARTGRLMDFEVIILEACNRACLEVTHSKYFTNLINIHRN